MKKLFCENKLLKIILLAVTFFLVLFFGRGVNALAYEDSKGNQVYLTYKAWQRAENPDGTIKFTWNETTDRIEVLLNRGVELYEEEQAAKKAGTELTEEYTAYKCISNAYYQWYDSCGFEKKVMGYVSGARVTEVELQYSTCRKTVNTDDALDELKTEVATLISMLRTDADILDDIFFPSGSSGGSTGAAWATFAACFGIVLREGVEAILIVAAIVAYLVKTDNKKKCKFVYIGVGVAVAASFGLAGILYWATTALGASSMSQELIEGITALVAVAVIIYVSNWLISKSESKAWTGYLDKTMKTGVSKGNTFTLAGTAFLAVFREGAEVILFYQPLVQNAGDLANGMLSIWMGLLVGLVAIVIIYILIRVFSVKLPLKPFFLVMSIFMSLMAVCFLGAGIKELAVDGNLTNGWGTTAISSSLNWMLSSDVCDFFGIYPLWITIIPQVVLLAVLVVTFIINLKRNKKMSQAQPAVAAEGAAVANEDAAAVTKSTEAVAENASVTEAEETDEASSETKQE